MSDGSLSQDEIDALLQGGGGMDLGAPEPQPSASGLTDQEQAVFLAMLEDIVGSQSANLSGMVGESVDIQQPTIEVMGNDELIGSITGEIVELKIDFTEGIVGDHSYILPSDIATTIAGKMMGPGKFSV